MSDDINTSFNTVQEGSCEVTEAQDQATNKDTKSKYWVFTKNNWTPVDILLLDELYSTAYLTYLVYGKEVGQSGTRHLQGYLELSLRQRFSQVKAKLPGFYIAQRRGTAEQAAEYCAKEDENFVQFGTRSQSQQGRRKDLERVANLVKDNASLKRIAEEEPEAFIKYHKGIMALKTILCPTYESTEFTEKRYNFTHDWSRTQIFIGPTNCGKTTYAKQLLPRALFCTHMDDLAKYDPENYDGIIYDEASFIHLPREAQIHLCDQAEDRSLHVRYLCARIPKHTKKIFTSNKTVGEIVLNDPAIERRIEVHQFVWNPPAPQMEMNAGGQSWN